MKFQNQENLATFKKWDFECVGRSKSGEATPNKLN